MMTFELHVDPASNISGLSRPGLHFVKANLCGRNAPSVSEMTISKALGLELTQDQELLTSGLFRMCDIGGSDGSVFAYLSPTGTLYFERGLLNVGALASGLVLGC